MGWYHTNGETSDPEIYKYTYSDARAVFALRFWRASLYSASETLLYKSKWAFKLTIGTVVSISLAVPFLNTWWNNSIYKRDSASSALLPLVAVDCIQYIYSMLLYLCPLLLLYSVPYFFFFFFTIGRSWTIECGLWSLEGISKMDQQLGDNYWAEGNSQDGFEVQEHSIFKQEIPDAADEENNEDETTEVRWWARIMTKRINSKMNYCIVCLQLVLSNKGGPKIIHKNFMYTLHKKQPYNIRWRCVRRALACRGSIITGADCKSPRLRMDHNHEADLMAVQCARRRYEAMGQPVILGKTDRSLKDGKSWFMKISKWDFS